MAVHDRNVCDTHDALSFDQYARQPFFILAQSEMQMQTSNTVWAPERGMAASHDKQWKYSMCVAHSPCSSIRSSDADKQGRVSVAHLSTVPVRGSTCTQLPDSADPQYTSAQQRPSKPRRDRAHMDPASCLIKHVYGYGFMEG